MSKKNDVDVERVLLNVVKRYYEYQDGPMNVDGEQFFMDNWIAPVDGCDTLQAMFDEIVEAVEEMLKERVEH